MKRTNLDIKQVDINTPILDPANARTGHDINGLAQSLDRYGLRKPIVVNKRTGIVLAGNGTLKAARQLGWQTIAVNYVDDDPQTAVGYALADNRLTDLSEFDNEALLLSLQQFDSMDDVIGFEQADYDELLAELGVDDDTSPPSLDELAAEYGEPQERDFWPYIKVQVSPETKELWDSLMSDIEGDDEAVKVATLLSSL